MGEDTVSEDALGAGFHIRPPDSLALSAPRTRRVVLEFQDRQDEALAFAWGHSLDTLKQFNRAHALTLTAVTVARKRRAGGPKGEIGPAWRDELCESVNKADN